MGNALNNYGDWGFGSWMYENVLGNASQIKITQTL